MLQKQIPSKLMQHFLKDAIHKEFIFDAFEIPALQYESGNISIYETVILCLLCKNLKPKRILEYGTFNGKTTVNLAANSPDDTQIITVDLPKSEIKNTVYPLEGNDSSDVHDELGYIGKTDKLFLKMDKSIKDKITQVWSDTALFSYNENYNHLSYDFIFIDASHKYENVLNDSIDAMSMLNSGGVILWHDYNGWPGVTQALNELYAQIADRKNFAHIENSSLAIYYKS